ncbi:MAG: efflux RND transporter periplasmic adaptor subunit [Acidobacteriota bacterium]
MTKSAERPEPPNRDDLDALLDTAPRKRRGLLVAGAACLALVGVLVTRPARSVDRQYDTVSIERRDLVATVSATGRLEPTEQVEVGSELSGLVAAVTVETNARVSKGQVLARIDTTKLERQTERSRAARASAEARLRQSEATRVEANADLFRLEELHRLSEGLTPARAELDRARAAQQRAEAAVSVAEADVAESKAAVLANEIDLQRSTIRSPIDGVVLERRVDPGQTVAASFQSPVLFTIGQDLSKMDLVVYVAEADVGRVTAGQTATFTVDAWPEVEFEAVVRKVSFGSQTVENVVSYEAELVVENAELRLRPGMTATASIRVAERNGVLAVSNAALRFRPPVAKASRGFSLLPRPPDLSASPAPDDEAAIHLLDEGELSKVLVEPGLSDGRWTEIRGDELRAGQPVVVEIVEAAT